MKQLSPVERFALAQVEYYEGNWKRERLAEADAEIEAQRKEFDARKMEEMSSETLVDAPSVATSTHSAAATTTSTSTDDDDNDVIFY